ncbi:hypothetical protein Agub_g9349, partial [Astrephomene gubernaculifera]
MAHYAPQQVPNIPNSVQLPRSVSCGVASVSTPGAPSSLARGQWSAAAGLPLCLCHLLRAQPNAQRRSRRTTGWQIGDWQCAVEPIQRAASIRGSFPLPTTGRRGLSKDAIVAARGQQHNTTTRLTSAPATVVQPLSSFSPPVEDIPLDAASGRCITDEQAHRHGMSIAANGTACRSSPPAIPTSNAAPAIKSITAMEGAAPTASSNNGPPALANVWQQGTMPPVCTTPARPGASPGGLHRSGISPGQGNNKSSTSSSRSSAVVQGSGWKQGAARGPPQLLALLGTPLPKTTPAAAAAGASRKPAAPSAPVSLLQPPQRPHVPACGGRGSSGLPAAAAAGAPPAGAVAAAAAPRAAVSGLAGG